MNIAKFLVFTPLLMITPYNRPYDPYSSKSEPSINPGDLIRNQSEYFSYSEEIFRPVDENETYTIKGSYTYNSTFSIEKCKHACYLYVKGDSAPYYKSFSKTFTLKYEDKYDFSYKVPSLKYYISTGIEAKIGVFCETIDDFVSYETINLYKKAKDVVNPVDYKKDYLTYKNTTKSSGKYISEKFLFNNFSDFIDSQYYLKLDLSNYSFEYDYIDDFKYKEAKLVIFDKYNLFPNLRKDNSGNRIINLKVSDDLHIVLNEELYINPISFDISCSPIEGYIKTNSIFLPKNQRLLMQDYEMSLEILSCGANSIDIVCPIVYSSDSNYFGNCNSDSYCLVGGIRR